MGSPWIVFAEFFSLHIMILRPWQGPTRRFNTVWSHVFELLLTILSNYFTSLPPLYDLVWVNWIQIWTQISIRRTIHRRGPNRIEVAWKSAVWALCLQKSLLFSPPTNPRFWEFACLPCEIHGIVWDAISQSRDLVDPESVIFKVPLISRWRNQRYPQSFTECWHKNAQKEMG